MLLVYVFTLDYIATSECHMREYDNNLPNIIQGKF